RVAADAVCDVLFAPSPDAMANLLAEGHPQEAVHLVGNVMIDSLRACMERAARSSVLSDLGVERQAYLVATLHRASNVDDPRALRAALAALATATPFGPPLLVAHPRTAPPLAAPRGDRPTR